MKASRTFQASLCALGTLAVAISMTACGSTAAVEPAAGQAAEMQVDEIQSGGRIGRGFADPVQGQ